MFSGIVTGVGRVATFGKRRGGAILAIRPPARYGRFRGGESLCVEGVCLTAIRPGRDFEADLSEETLSRSTLGSLRAGDPVNLERSLRFRDRLSGHFVLGHVDGVSRLLEIREAGRSWTYRFSVPAGLSRYIVPKGSVAVDGISLTVARRRSRSFDVAIIPVTRRRTTLSSKRVGSGLNLEIDLFARYGIRGWKRRIQREATSRRR